MPLGALHLLWPLEDALAPPLPVPLGAFVNQRRNLRGQLREMTMLDQAEK